jgi:hypothetical protein
MFAAAKGRDVVADTGDLQSRGTGGQHAIFLGRVFSVAGHAFNESKFQIFTDLAPEANAELPSEVPTPLPAPVHPAGLPVGGIFTPPAALWAVLVVLDPRTKPSYICLGLICDLY